MDADLNCNLIVALFWLKDDFMGLFPIALYLRICEVFATSI